MNHRREVHTRQKTCGVHFRDDEDVADLSAVDAGRADPESVGVMWGPQLNPS
ncbi:MAG: hypothetical protein VYA34_13515 [Myxococcota bacterium]|nr:hypothetical protein [Myxococcota bacterium]